jgi:hypothetical protein
MSKRNKHHQKQQLASITTPKETEDVYLSPKVSEWKLATLVGYLIAAAVIIALIIKMLGILPSNLDEESNSSIPNCFEQCQANSDPQTCQTACRSQQLESIALPKD